MRRTAIAVRVCALLLLLATPLLPTVNMASSEQSVVFVVDRSMSVGAETLRGLEEELLALPPGSFGVVTVASDAELLLPVGEVPPTAPGWLGAPDHLPGTELSRGLRLAGWALPDFGGRRVVVLTDGNATGPAPGARVRELRRAGIQVDVLSLPPAVPLSHRIAGVTAASASVREGEPVVLTARIVGPPGDAVVNWHSVGGDSADEPFTQWVTLGDEGFTDVTWVDPNPSSGLRSYRASLPTAPTSEGRMTAVRVEGRPKVLMVTATGERPSLLVDALTRAETDVETLHLADAELDAAALSEADLVILADVPLAREGEVALVAGLSETAQESLLNYVRERGGGLFVTGGGFGFGPEYADAPLARALPLQVEDQGEVEDPPVAMAIMLDRSGSMGTMVGEHTKLQLAIEASLAAAFTLRQSDRVGIASVDTETVWHQPLAPANELLASRERVRNMGLGGGGIYVYTALADAYRLLGDAPEPVRHVIVFSDAADSEEQFLGCPFTPCPVGAEPATDLARTALSAGITTSVVGIGEETDSDVAFLTDLAAAGGGRYYLTNRGTDLRRIFVAETRATARTNFRQGPVVVLPGDAHPISVGIDLREAPALLGLVNTNRRSTADTILVTDDDRPILSTWRYGLGQVVALTSDGGGRWSGPWAQWPGGGQLMVQAVRAALRDQSTGSAEATLSVGPREARLTVEVSESARAAGQLPHTLEAFARDAQGHEKVIEGELRRIAPGLFEARLPLDGESVVHARVRDAEGQLMVDALGVAESQDELVSMVADDRLLGELAALGGGQVLDAISDGVWQGADGAPRPMALWPLILVLAALLATLDLWLRRLGRRPKQTLEELLAQRSGTKPEESKPVQARELDRAA